MSLPRELAGSPPSVVAVRELGLLALDALDAADLALFCALDERPLQAAAGYVDWRTNGWLSRLIVTGQFRCQRGERLLTLSQGRLSASRVFLFGLGESKSLTIEAARALGEECSAALNAAEVVDLAIGYPGAGDPDAHAALLEILQKKIRVAKMTTWGPWRKLS